MRFSLNFFLFSCEKLIRLWWSDNFSRDLPWTTFEWIHTHSFFCWSLSQLYEYPGQKWFFCFYRGKAPCPLDSELQQNTQSSFHFNRVHRLCCGSDSLNALLNLISKMSKSHLTLGLLSIMRFKRMWKKQNRFLLRKCLLYFTSLNHSNQPDFNVIFFLLQKHHSFGLNWF